MVLSFNDNFEVTWRNPEDANKHWQSRADRIPSALPALSQDVMTAIYDVGFGSLGSRLTWVNGIAFQIAPSGYPPLPQEMRSRSLNDIWFDAYEPQMREATKSLREREYDLLSDADLAAELPSLFEEVGRTILHTLTVVDGMNEPVHKLVNFCEKHLGEQGPSLAMTLLQGFSNRSADAAESLRVLAGIAANHPDLVDALGHRRFDRLEELDGGLEFMDHFRSFLDEFGWRLESWALLHMPTWQEQPAQALELVARLLSTADSIQVSAQERAAEQREQTQAQIEQQLPGHERADFLALLAPARNHVPIKESRAFWQLTLLGCLRKPVLTLGRKLVASGVIEDADDVWFLSSNELMQACAGPTASRSGLVTLRRADLERWRKLTPPRFIGAPLRDRPPQALAGARLLHGRGEPSLAKRTITGQAASLGVVKGRARIIRGLEDSERLESGDILVCQMTSPPWTPLFAIAAGVVTDTGGVLSHSAICAREFALPCVVATQVATSTIPDGATITVDGSRGTVTIED